jgi:hypothetical protein
MEGMAFVPARALEQTTDGALRAAE